MSIAWLTNGGSLTEPDEMHGTAKETWSNEQVSCDVQLRAKWSDRHGIMSNLLTAPLAWPYHSNGNVYAVSGGMQPMIESATKDGSGLVYEFAILSVHFETLTKSTGGNNTDVTIFSESIDPTANFLTIPPDGFFWKGSGSQLTPLKQEEAPGKLEIGLDYGVTYYNLTFIPAAALTLIGSVNSAPVVSPSLGLTFGAETLLYNPPKITRNITTQGNNRYTMACRFTYKQAGWNQFWRAETGGYSRIYYPDGTTPYNNYPLQNFAGVLP